MFEERERKMNLSSGKVREYMYPGNVVGLLGTTKNPLEISDQTFRVKVVEMVMFFLSLLSIIESRLNENLPDSIINTESEKNFSVDERHE